MSQSEINLSLHPKQGEAFLSPATEILYGGAAGGGKSHLMRTGAITWCAEIPGLQVYLFRRVREDLVKNHVEGPKGLRALLAGWVLAGLVKIVEDEIRFWNGSKIYLCHCKDEKDRFKYLGAEIHVLLIDELTTFTEVIYRFLRGRVRAVGLPELPEHYKGKFPRIINSSNPGNVGHVWVKMAFIDRLEPMEIRKMPDSDGGMLRQFIPAKLEDNPSMETDDPGYRSRLRGLGSESLVRAMELGDWDVIEGAYFSEWCRDHVIERFDIPDHWMKMISGDWGSAKPFSFGWWAVASEDYLSPSGWIPKGAMVRYQEWYGVKRNESGEIEPNVGVKLTAEEVGRGLSERGCDVDRSVLDPAAFAEDGGPSIAERIRQAGGPFFQRADNKRVARNGAMGGWDQLRSRLKGEDFGEPIGERPMIFTFNTCKDSIRTIPALQHDSTRPEDLDSDMEDHCFAAGTLVDTPKGQIPIEKMAETGIVYTHLGPRRYRSCGLIKRQADTVELTFSDGRKVRCTKDHLFLTESGKWVPAEEMTGEWSYNITFEDDICQKLLVTPFKSFVGSVITCVESISRKMGSDYTALYGWTQMAQSPAGSTCITSTTTEQTTVSRTLSWHRGQPILVITPKNLVTEPGLSELRRPMQQSGMEARKVGLGILSILKGIFARSWKSGFLRSAKNAAMSIWSARPELSRASIARASAKHVRCVSVGKPRRDDVYCLTSPTTNTFSINGGIIVHNCADEWRYGCMARPYVKGKPEKPEQRPRDAFERALHDFEEAESWKVA